MTQKLVETNREKDVVSLSFSLPPFIYAEVQETNSVVSFLTATAAPSPLHFNHLEAHAERDAT